MNILIDIGHPGHVHFFKNFIWEMKKKGHDFIITARKKDVIEDLLNQYNIEYILRGSIKEPTLSKALDMPRIDLKLMGIILKYDIDYVLGILNPYVAQSSFVMQRKSIIFSDTEHAILANKLTIPFCNAFITPTGYLKNFGTKQIRYNGYQELAYLHPNWFTPDPSIFNELGLSKDDKYVIIRFVSWAASHDVGNIGLKNKEKINLIKEIEKFANPIITSENTLPRELSKYQIRIPPHRIHDALYFAHMYIGEGGTMATESAVMGTPNILINPLAKYCGIHNDLQRNYKLQLYFNTIKDSHKTIIEFLKNTKLKNEWKNKKEKMLNEKIDVSKFMIEFIENYRGH